MKILCLFCVLFFCCSKVSETEHELFQRGVKQITGNFVEHNKYMVNVCLADSICWHYFVKAGMPKITYDSYGAHDAITDKYGITINSSIIYDEKQMKELLLVQFGIYYALTNESR